MEYYGIPEAVPFVPSFSCLLPNLYANVPCLQSLLLARVSFPFSLLYRPTVYGFAIPAGRLTFDSLNIDDCNSGALTSYPAHTVRLLTLNLTPRSSQPQSDPMSRTLVGRRELSIIHSSADIPSPCSRSSSTLQKAYSGANSGDAGMLGQRKRESLRS